MSLAGQHGGSGAGTWSPGAAGRMPLSIAGALLICLLLMPATVKAQASDITLEQQPLAQSLNQLAQRLDLQILVPPALVRGKTAPALSGRHAAASALRLLLAGSGLGYRQSASGVITIVDLPHKVPAAKAALQEPATLPTVGTSLNTLQVTGSRIRRSEFEAAAPLTIITAGQMEREGRFSLAEALASNGMNDYGAESQGAGRRFSANSQPLNLRGLGPGRALILVDGRRLPDYPFPSNGRSNFQSLGGIPIGSVDRVEVMTGGASAIYGADAIAGVVNIVLKHPREGSQLKVRTGTTGQGGADRVELQWSRGHAGDDWQLDYGVQYAHRELLRGFQRDLQHDGLAGQQPELGVGLLRTGQAASAGHLVPMPAGVCERWNGEFVDWNYSTAALSGAGCGTWRNAGYASLADGMQEVSAQMHAEWSISARTQAWLTLQGWRADSALAAGFETITGPHSVESGKVNQIYDPRFGYLSPRRILTPQEVGGLGMMNDRYRERMWDVALGLRGRHGQRLDWALTLGSSDYLVQRERRRLLGDKVNAFFFGEPSGVTDDGIIIQPLNLQHWYRPITPREYAALSSRVHYRAQTKVESASYVASGGILDLPAGPLGIALVLEASQQRYRLQNTPSVVPLDMQLYDVTGSVGAGRRDRRAIGGELSVPVTATVRASFAGRLDNYRDDAANYLARTRNAGLEWRPIPGLLLRASRATSFKVPDMHWVFTDGGGSYGSAVDAVRCINAGANPGCEGYASEFLTWTYRNPALSAETGTSTTAGLVWDAGDEVSMSLDFWQVSNAQGIGRISPAQLLRDEAECVTGLRLDGSPAGVDLRSWECRKARAQVVRTGGDGTGAVVRVESTAANQSEQRLRGVDTVLDWRTSTGIGDFNVHAAWTHTFWGQRRIRSPGTLHEQWRAAQWASGENLAFRSNVSGSVGWQGRQGWSGNLFGIRYGRLRRADGDGWVQPLWLLNASVGKRLGQRAVMTVFINNVFNTAPPRDSSNDRFPYYYDEVYSAIGRQFAVQLDYNFD